MKICLLYLYVDKKTFDQLDVRSARCLISYPQVGTGKRAEEVVARLLEGFVGCEGKQNLICL